MIKKSMLFFSNLPVVNKTLVIAIMIMITGVYFQEIQNKTTFNYLEFEPGSTANQSYDGGILRLSDFNKHEAISIDADSVGLLESEDTVNYEFKHTIQSGDTIISILNQYGLETSEVIGFVNKFPQFGSIQLGQEISWKISSEGKLTLFTWVISDRETRIYELINNKFEERIILVNGIWSEYLIVEKINKNINGTFNLMGLSKNEVMQIKNAIGWQIDLDKIANGDEIRVLFNREKLNDKIAKSKLLAVKINMDKAEYYGFRAGDGAFYDENGRSPKKGFLKRPTTNNFRVSSEFNPRRLNPVTKKYLPHNGTDYPMPIGTPILAVANGVVSEVKNEKAAGNYITIKHNGNYVTRYMHLKSFQVKSGDKVKQGQKIGLSGNTGRTTGPNLHYELWMNGKPLNPEKANVVRSQTMTNSEKNEFKEVVKVLMNKLNMS